LNRFLRIALLAVIATLVSACSGASTVPTGSLNSGAVVSHQTISSYLRPARISREASAPGSLTYYRAPAQAPYAGNNFVLEPSNSIWYVSGSASADQITQFAPPNKKKTFTLPSVCGTSGDFVPSGLANGADGRLWFGSLCGGIGALSTSGSVQSYGLPPNCSNSGCSTQLGAVAGNQIWFTSTRAGAKDNLYVGFIDTGMCQ
jgi:streptogramin lyase